MDKHIMNMGFSNQSFTVLELSCSSLGCVRVWCTFCGTSGTKGATTMVPCLHFRQTPVGIQHLETFGWSAKPHISMA